MHPNPRKIHRMASGQAHVTADSTHLAQISLYNNATDGSFLAVWDWENFAPGGAIKALFSFVQGTVGTLAMAGTSLMVGQPQLAGQVFSALTVTTQGSGFYISADALGDKAWPHDLVFCVLRPGWSLVSTNNDNTQEFNVAFVWQVWRDYEIEKFIDYDL